LTTLVQSAETAARGPLTPGVVNRDVWSQVMREAASRAERHQHMIPPDAAVEAAAGAPSPSSPTPTPARPRWTEKLLLAGGAIRLAGRCARRGETRAPARTG